MAQQQWTVPGYGGVPYNVGMYHGVKTGHLLIQCNGNIITIDFGVKGDKEYSFMLGEEVYELKIIKNAQTYTYQLIHNEEIETPHNVRRNKTEKSDKRRLWAAIITLGLVIVTIMGVRYYWANLEDNVRHRLAEGQGQLTDAHILKEGQNWLIVYKAEGKIIKKQLVAEDSISTLGYDIATGDGYQIRLLPKYRYIYLIDWTQPDIRTTNRLVAETVERHQALHPTLIPRQIRCQLQQAYDLEGIEGVAKFHQQDITHWPVYNQDSYLRLIRSKEYKDLIQTCLLGLTE